MTFRPIYGSQWANGPMAATLEVFQREKNAKPGVASLTPASVRSCLGIFCKGHSRSRFRFVEGSNLCHRCAGRLPCK